MNSSSAPSEVVWDPGPLTQAQRTGVACVSCHKRWPLPQARVGVLPDQRPVYACRGCAKVPWASRSVEVP
jgi:hypothetical protein